MLIGDTSMFAVESGLTVAWESRRWRGAGWFILHVGGREYGLRRNDAASLGCHLLNLKEQIARRGIHVAPFAEEPDAHKIAFAFRHSVYAEESHDIYLGLPALELSRISSSSDLLGLTNGQEAFDDGSEVLQFDIGGRVRLIAYTSRKGWAHDPETLRDTWLPADAFYGVLQRWVNAFESEWSAMPKSAIPA